MTQDTPGQPCKLANKEDGDIGRLRTREILISNEPVTQGMMPSGFFITPYSALLLLCCEGILKEFTSVLRVQEKYQ